MHGGGFADGNKSEGPFIGFPTAFAKLGYVAVSIDYRLLAPKQCIEPLLDSQVCRDAAAAATDDAQTAIRFLRANANLYGIDPERIAIAGESAGAIAATSVGLHADDETDSVRAWVSLAGGVDNGEGVDAKDAPGLLIANTGDPWVPFEWSSETAAAMQAAGVPVVLRPLQGVEHVPVSEFGQVMLDESRDFLYEHLDLESADQ
jgi:acetyl esterase/lipase